MAQDPAQELATLEDGRVTVTVVGFVFLRFLCNVEFQKRTVVFSRVSSLD